jgi:hypothetical protein
VFLNTVIQPVCFKVITQRGTEWENIKQKQNENNLLGQKLIETKRIARDETDRLQYLSEEINAL